MNNDEILKRLVELETRVDQIETRLSVVETTVESTLNLFGNYKNRTNEELKLMSDQIALLIRTVESLVTTAEHSAALERAKSLRRRLMNNNTRINKQLNAKKRHA